MQFRMAFLYLQFYLNHSLKSKQNMKKSLFFILFIAFSNGILAQQTAKIEQLDAQRHRETYVNRNGKDSIKFTISGKNDTLLTEQFLRMGQLKSKTWRKDSTHVFDVFGRLREVFYLRDDTSETPSISYHFNGEVSKRFRKTPTGDVTEVFNRKGNLEVVLTHQ